MKRPLPLTLLSLALVAVAADLAQWAALEYYVNLYPVEYTLFYLLSALALTRAVLAREEGERPLRDRILKVFLPLLAGIVALSLLANFLLQSESPADYTFRTMFFSQLILHFSFVFGCWLLDFLLRRFLWRQPPPDPGRRALAGALALVLVTALLHALCSVASLRYMTATEAVWLFPAGDSRVVSLIYAIQQGISYLTFALTALLLDGVSGGLAGAIGLALADILAGDPGYAVTTFVLKFIIGITCGAVAHKVFKLRDLDRHSKGYLLKVIVAGGSGLLLNVITDPFLGYFRNIYIFGQEYTVAQALSKIAGGVTFVNSVVSTICVVILYLALRPALERAGLLPKGEKK